MPYFKKSLSIIDIKFSLNVLENSVLKPSGLRVFFFFFLAAPHGLQDLTSPTRDRTLVLAVKASPNCWTTRELLWAQAYVVGSFLFTNSTPSLVIVL